MRSAVWLGPASILWVVLAGCVSSGAGPQDAGVGEDAQGDAAVPADAPPTVVSCTSPSAAPVPDEITQVLLVTTPSWTDAQGSLARFTRTAGGPWTAVGGAIPVALGDTGLGWGRGLHGGGPPTGCDGPTKHEGDHRSPAGVFTLGGVYGDTANAGSFPYTLLTSTWRCPDDPASAFYNQVLDSATVAPDWSSAEVMARPDGLYHWVVFVEHNTGPPVPGAGSCIFIHVWSGPSSTTVGCTAMSLAALEGVLPWLDPPRAVQVALPQPVYEAVRAEWQLP